MSKKLMDEQKNSIPSAKLLEISKLLITDKVKKEFKELFTIQFENNFIFRNLISNGNYTDNNPTNSPDATGVNRKGTYLKLTFTVPTSQKILVRFMFPLQPLGSATSVYNFQSTLSSSASSVVPLRSSGIASDYYEASTHSDKNTLNSSHNEVVQFYIDASKLDTPKAAGSSMTVYFCAQDQSLGNSHRMDFGTQNVNGSHGGVTSAAIMGIAYSLDDVPIYEPAL